MQTDPNVETVYLGQYTWDNANAIAERLEESGIVWWQKQAGSLMKVLSAQDWGVRLFVDRARLEDARSIVRDVCGR